MGTNYRQQRRRENHSAAVAYRAGASRRRGGLLARATAASRADSYHQQLLWIGHQPGIKTRLSALENLRFFHHDGDIAQCLAALAQAGLAGYEDIPVNQLSAGQQRRVALARLWLTRARLWILDEPFTAIDVNGVERLTQRMAQHTEQGGIVILTTHQPLNVETDKVRRIALTSERATQ